MRIRPDLKELADRNYDEGLDWRLAGTREMAETLAAYCAQELRVDEYTFGASRTRRDADVPALTIRVHSPRGSGPIGTLIFTDAPRQFVWLRIPRFRGSESPSAFKPDEKGHLLAAYLTRLAEELERSGYLSVSSNLRARQIIDSAYQQLYVSEDPSSYAAIGNMGRSALVALGNDIYEEWMLPTGQPSPKGDDVKTKLRLFLRSQVSSPRFRDGLEKVADGTRTMASAFLHRKAATREEAEVCLAQVTALVDSMAHLKGISD